MNSTKNTSQIINEIKLSLYDSSARNLAENVQLIYLDEISKSKEELYPVAIVGSGSPILLLHGFDSSFLEFRRIAPLLKNNHRLIIPDLYGFGFCPRPKSNEYGSDGLIKHLRKIIEILSINEPVSVIGASMGGAVAIKFAKLFPERINRIFLLSPAGLTTKSKKVPRPFDSLGTWFLKQSFVRKKLCQQAFADPQKSVGKEEEQIASAHLKVPGWQRSLAAFARNGGVSAFDLPKPSHPIHVIWGSNDNIIKRLDRQKSTSLLGIDHFEINNCGHLPHLDKPEIVVESWKNFIEID